MDVLFVDFSYDDNVKCSTRRIARRLGDRKNEYSGVKARLSSIQSNTGNITNANMYLEKKMRQLEEKRDKLTAFGKAVDAFDDNARETDKRVAKRLEKQIKSFCKREGIPGVFQTMLTQGGKKLLITASKIGLLGPIPLVIAYKDKIKEWYQKHKTEFWLAAEVAFDAFIIVASVALLIMAPGGFVAAFPLVWGALKSGVDLVYDWRALGAACRGDMESAQALRKMGMEQVMQGMLGDTAGTWVYRGLEVVSFVCGVTQLTKDIRSLKTCDNMLKYGTKGLAPRVQTVMKQRVIKMTTGVDIGKVTIKSVLKNGTTFSKTMIGILNGKSLGELILSMKGSSTLGLDKLYSWYVKPMLA